MLLVMESGRAFQADGLAWRSARPLCVESLICRTSNWPQSADCRCNDHAWDRLVELSQVSGSKAVWAHHGDWYWYYTVKVVDLLLRKITLSFVIFSLFTWSNESLNIWSHLIGFFIFLFLLIYDIVVSFPVLHCSFTDQLIASIALCCYQV